MSGRSVVATCGYQFRNVVRRRSLQAVNESVQEVTP